MLAVVGWTVLALVVADVAVGLLFPMPADVRRPPSQLAAYFDYGRSIDGKLDRLVGPDDARSAPIVAAGWIARDCARPPAPAPAGKTGVTIYGMSFTERVATQMAAIDPRIVPATYAGPAAPLSHSVACAEAVARAGRDPNRIWMVGVLASSLGRLETLGGLTTSFEGPAPFTYPRYRPAPGGGLAVAQPLVASPEQLRDPARRAAYLAQLAQDDAFYDPWLVDHSVTDRSVVLRMIRRAYAQAEGRRLQARLVTDRGHALRPEVRLVAERLLLRFAALARVNGATPIVLLLQDRGSDPDLLYRSLAPALAAAHVPTVSTHAIAPNGNPANFVADGHFKPEVDGKIARQVLATIARAHPKS